LFQEDTNVRGIRLTAVAAELLIVSSLARADAADEIGGVVLKRGPRDVVLVSRDDWAWGRAVKHPVISFDMKSNRYEWRLRHDSPGQPRVGIEAPTRCNWYQSGMIKLKLGGKPFTATDETLAMDQGEKGRVTLAWEGELGKLRYEFVALPSDDRLYLQATLQPAGEAGPVEVSLSNYISGYNRRNPDHVLHTPVRVIEKRRRTDLDPATEHAVFYSDRALDPADGRGEGPSAIVVAPEGLAKFQTVANGYGSTTILEFAPGTTRLRFAFWEFPKWTNREALEYWRQSFREAERVLRSPETFAFGEELAALRRAAPPERVAPPVDGGTPGQPPAPPAPGRSQRPDRKRGDAPEYRDNLYYDASDEVPTPHLTWAKPYVKGPCRVLVIAPRWGQRETVELMQRFDVECDVLMTMKHDLLGGRGYGSAQFMTVDKVARQFDLMLAKEFDVIVVGFFDWRQLLIEHRRRILEKAYAGTGLVFVRPWRSEELAQVFAQAPLAAGAGTALTAGVPWGELSVLEGVSPDRAVYAGAFGQGRWVTLHYPTGGTNHCLTPCRVPWPPEAHWEYEYCQSLVARLLFWAGRKEAPAAIESVGVSQIERAQAPVSVPVRIRSEVALSGLRLAPSFHRLPTREVIAGTPAALKLAPGENVAAVSVPPLPAGRYMANLRVLDSGGKVVCWFSSPLQVVGACSVAEIATQRHVYDAGEPLRGKVALSRALAAGETLAIRWQDNHGRLLAERVETEGREWQATLPGIRPLDTNIHFLRAVLSDASGEAASAEREFSVRGRRRPAFHLAIWEEPQSDYMSDLWYRRFREMGVDAIYYTIGRKDYAAASRLIARNDLFSAPMFVAYCAEAEESDIGSVHRNCLHDPAFRQAVEERNLEVAKHWGRYDVLYYTDGSDKGMHGQCFAQLTLAAFREHLRKRYASLDELNRAWAASFDSWDAVVPDTLAKAKARGNFTSWVQHTRFMETAFVENDRRMDATLRSLDPDALMGHDGYGRLNSNDGADWWQLLQVNTYYNLYTYQDPPQLEVTRSIADCFPTVRERSIYYGSYTGQFGNYPFLRRLPWYALLHNYTGLFWWIANGKVSYSSLTSYMVGPDFRPTKSYMVSKVEMDEINGGVFQLIAGAQRRHGGVALYYDHAAAVHAMTAFEHPTVLVRGYTAFQHLLEDLGLQYNYVVPQQIEAGRLAAEGYRVLVLVHTLAMSETSAKAIAEFVRSGGLVIANVTPAAYDHDLGPAPGGSLLAAVLGEADELRREGQGAVLVLGDPHAGYARQRFAPEGVKVRQRFAGLLREFGAAPEVGAAPAAGDAGVPGLEFVVYQSGPARYVGVIHSGADPISTTVKASSSGHVYDMRARKALGSVQEWPLSLRDGETALYAVLPYAVGAPAAAPGAPSAGVRGKQFDLPISLQTADGGPATLPHAFVVTVADPAGRERPEYGQVVTSAGDGTVVVTIPFALNDPPGRWQVRVTERVGNGTTQVPVDLR